MLRDPVYRAYSHYQMNKKDDPSGSFLTALEKESAGEVVYHYLDSSLYAKQLNHWFAHFPQEQFLILKSETFFTDPQNTMAEVYNFLELKDHPVKEFERLNENQYQAINNEDYQTAMSYFKSDLEELNVLLGQEFQWNHGREETSL